MARTGTATPPALARVGYAALRARWWLLLLVPLLAVGVAAALRVDKPGYRAEVTLAFPTREDSAAASLGIPSLRPPTADQILSDAVLQSYRVAVKDPSVDPRPQLRASANSQSARIIAEGDFATATRRLAARWATAVITLRNAQTGAQLTGVRDDLRAQLGRVPPDPLGAARRADLTERLDRLAAVTRSRGPDIELARGASVSARSSPAADYLPIALLGVLGGALVALALAAADRRPRTAQALASAIDLPLVAQLSPANGRAPEVGNGPGTGQLLARLILAAGGQQPPTLLVTAAERAEDAALAAAAVATAIASNGSRVALIGWSPGESRGALQDDFENDAITTVDERESWPNFLGRVAEQSLSHDVVVVCAPPMLECSEAILAAQVLGAWFVCARLDETGDDDARSLQQAIASLEKPPAGILVIADERRGLGRLVVETDDAG